MLLLKTYLQNLLRVQLKIKVLVQKLFYKVLFDFMNCTVVLFSYFKFALTNLFFRETREKINITWHPNGTVSYYQVKRWFYEPELTKGSLNDLVTTLNVPFVVSFCTTI